MPFSKYYEKMANTINIAIIAKPTINKLPDLLALCLK